MVTVTGWGVDLSNMLRIFTPFTAEAYLKQQSQPNTPIPSCRPLSFARLLFFVTLLEPRHGTTGTTQPPPWVHLKKMAGEEMNNYIKPPPPELLVCLSCILENGKQMQIRECSAWSTIHQWRLLLRHQHLRLIWTNESSIIHHFDAAQPPCS